MWKDDLVKLNSQSRGKPSAPERVVSGSWGMGSVLRAERGAGEAASESYLPRPKTGSRTTLLMRAGRGGWMLVGTSLSVWHTGSPMAAELLVCISRYLLSTDRGEPEDMETSYTGRNKVRRQFFYHGLRTLRFEFWTSAGQHKRQKVSVPKKNMEEGAAEPSRKA